MMEHIYMNLHETASSQAGVFVAIADIASKAGICTSPEAVKKGLAEREALSTTGFQDGFAIPHTQSDTITKPALVIVRTETGIEWDAFDGKPCFFFLSLLIPNSEAGTTHLQALSALSRGLMDETKRQKLLETRTNEEMLAVLKTDILTREDV
ncbi:PTS sugar transporter subunit IIA [Bacillus altitudinis]|uniref:PTS sugar transporter subunit IIA n=1 Tax=Bacillus altitudinis TaxID=293387 RepID=UPI002556F241|nr:fructose PTS transporter subunit IIA [Bacillus altitudinis]